MRYCRTTKWQLIRSAPEMTPEARRAAVAAFFDAYQTPLQAYARRAFSGLDAADIDDLVQGFVAEKVAAGSLLAKPPRKIRFRDFLRISFHRYAITQHHKRRPGLWAPAVDLMGRQSDAASEFDRRWAHGLIAAAAQDCRDEATAKGVVLEWQLLLHRVILPCLEGATPRPYAEFREAFPGISNATMANLLVNAKRRFARRLQRRIEEYAGPGGGALLELCDLRAALAATPPEPVHVQATRP